MSNFNEARLLARITQELMGPQRQLHIFLKQYYIFDEGIDHIELIDVEKEGLTPLLNDLTFDLDARPLKWLKPILEENMSVQDESEK